MLQKIKYIQNIGRFAKTTSAPGAVFGKCTLIFGENGWGKSTLADMLRSLASRDSTIIIGRKTLGEKSEQKAALQFEGNTTVCFKKGVWVGPELRIAVYDEVFINNNVFSGHSVTKEHLKNQYGLAVGEKGVQLIRQIISLDDENNENNRVIREAENELKAIIQAIMSSPTVSVDDFLKFGKPEKIDEAISKKQTEIRHAQKATELRAAGEPDLFTVPTESEKFKQILETSIDEIATKVFETVRSHVAKHSCEDAGGKHTTHENWIEIGGSFSETGNCPYCGQALQDRTLVDAYKVFFSERYKEISRDVQNARLTFAKYKKKEFHKKLIELNNKNQQQYAYWKESTKLIAPDMANLPNIIQQIEQTAEQMDNLFREKQINLTDALASEKSLTILEEWENGRAKIQHLNDKIGTYQKQIQELKSNLNPCQLPEIENQLKYLQLTKLRYESDIVKTITQLQRSRQRKEEIKIQKKKLRENLTEYERSIISSFGATINAYLECQNAEFRIDYKEPDYKGKGPAANYQIVIRDVPINATADDIGQPSFRNTLSAGDKSNLALAFFLAKTNASPHLAETIVVLDDPFASLDDFRRQSTAIEIRRICNKAKQTVVLSHNKNFLRLLWDKIDRTIIKSIILRPGASNITSIELLDIEKNTQPRHITERTKIEEFVSGEAYDSVHIRTRLRTVCENFYRNKNQNFFMKNDSLDEIIRKIEAAPNGCPYKEALENLNDINEYTRSSSHAEIQGNPNEETSDGELKGFCKTVLRLTSGMK